MQIDDKIPLFEYDVPGLDGMDHVYGPQPPYQNQSLVSWYTCSLPVVRIPKAGVQGTRLYTESQPALDADAQPGRDDTKEDKTDPWSKERIVYMKDTWRFLTHRTSKSYPNTKFMPHSRKPRHRTSPSWSLVQTCGRARRKHKRWLLPHDCMLNRGFRLISTIDSFLRS